MFSSRYNSAPYLRHKVKLSALLQTVCLLLPLSTHGQAAQNQQREPSELEAAVARASSGKVSARDVVVIADSGRVQAIPALEEQFRQMNDIDTKISIASGLVKLKDQNDTYWNFLLDQVTQAVDSDLPDPIFNSDGSLRQEPMLADISAWAQGHHVDVNTALQLAMYGLPGRVMQLGLSGDPRGIPLLRRALHSHHSMIVIMAAKSLAQMQDKGSISLIVEACRRSNVLAGAVAEASLVFFDDPQAQSAVDAYVPPDRAKIWRDARAQGLKPFGN